MPPVQRVLIASASGDWCERVARALEDPGVEVLEVRTGRAALETAQQDSAAPAAAVVDAALPDMTGLGLCRRLRESERSGELPILMVSRFAEEIDRILAFENGVDDFLPDPFFDRELASRLRAVLRRDGKPSPMAAAGRLQRGPLRVDPERAVAELDGRRLELTLREFELLQQLVENEGRVLRREDLAPPGEDGLAPNPRVVDTHVKALRRKLGRARRCIETVRGIGYRFSSRGVGAR